MKLVAALFLAFTIVLALAKDWQTVVEYAPVVGLAALLFNLLSLTVGYWVPRLLSIPNARRSPSAWRSASTTAPWPLPWR
jgi:BASS family bile acid:Na+ symporter